MKKIRTYLLLVILGISVNSFAQLSVGSIAPNFTLTDINGNTHTLYDYLDQGKTVVLDFSTTWCDFCWTYHENHVLEDFYSSYGPNGTDEVMVFFIEGDINTTSEDLHGTGPNTLGDWVTGVEHPILDITELSIISDYKIPGWPIIYEICPDRFIIHSDPGGQSSPGSVLYSKVGECNKGEYNNDIKIINTQQPEDKICNDFAPSVFIQNFGTNELTSFDIVTKVDGDIVNTYNWTGSMQQYDFTNIILNTIDISSYDEASHVYSVETTNPNGNTDEDNTNNIFSKDFIIETTGKTPVELIINPDLFPSQISWYIKKGNETILTGYNYNSDSDTNIFEALCLDKNTCYTYIIYDSANDGFTKLNGNVTMTSLGDTLFTFTEVEHNGPFYSVDFCVDTANSVASIEASSIQIYPNPAKDFIIIEKTNNNNINEIQILNITGNVLFKTLINDKIYKLDIRELPKGIYFIKVDRRLTKFIKE